MAAGSRDRPPMLATGRYAQWQSRLLRYIDIRPNGDALRKCILEGPYQPTTVTILAVPAIANSLAVPAIANSLAVPERTTVETILTMSLENKAHYKSEKEAIHLLLTRIGDEIYSTVDACKTAHEMWIDIKRLQQEWSRFVTIIQQQHDLDTVSYHKLFDILRQYQKEVNEIRVERIAKNANPLALVAAASPYPDPYYQAPKSHKPYAPTSKQSSSTRSNASTKFKGKEIAKPIIPPSESASEEDSDPEQAQRDKDMQKNLALIAKIPKRVKDSMYHKENMLLCKQDEKGVPLQADQSDWLAETDEDIDEQELEAHYSFMAKINEVPTADLGTDTELLEHVQNNAEYNVFANVRKHSEQPESTSNTCLVEKDDSNVTPDSLDMCDNDI
ncbi:hypothetical protein Tco_0199212 [Tanacetum coccineum]